MSQFLVVKDLNFENIMICFDNSNEELEYTTYKVSNKKKDYIFNQDIKHYIGELLDNGYEELPHGIFLYYNPEDNLVNITKLNQQSDQTILNIYNYKEHDGGVQEIPFNQSIYSSRFDDMRDAMMQVLGGYINTEHIFEIEE